MRLVKRRQKLRGYKWIHYFLTSSMSYGTLGYSRVKPLQVRRSERAVSTTDMTVIGMGTMSYGSLTPHSCLSFKFFGRLQLLALGLKSLSLLLLHRALLLERLAADHRSNSVLHLSTRGGSGAAAVGTVGAMGNMTRRRDTSWVVSHGHSPTSISGVDPASSSSAGVRVGGMSPSRPRHAGVCDGVHSTVVTMGAAVADSARVCAHVVRVAAHRACTDAMVHAVGTWDGVMSAQGLVHAGGASGVSIVRVLVG